MIICLQLILMGACHCVPPAPRTNLSKHAALHLEDPNTREPVSPDKQEDHPEQEPHGADQQNNMIY